MTHSASPRKHPRLLALSAAAMALPALAPSAQAVAPTERTLSYRYTQYNESSLDPNLVSDSNKAAGGGSNKRYDIDVNQFSFSSPVGDSFAMTLDVQDEVLSGATPWATELVDVNNTPTNKADDVVKVVMSGASIREHRTEANLASTYFYSSGTVSANVGFSTEDDYDSTSFGLSWGGEFDQKQTGVALGVSYSDDTVDPEEGPAAPEQQLSAKRGGWLNGSDPIVGTASKESVSSFMSVSRIISPNWIVQGGFSYAQKTGHLSDAYKRNDVRPDERNQYTFNLASRYWIKPIKSAFHVDYRYYDDDWGVSSHTLGVSLYKNWQKLQLIPSVRLYTQSEASFYTPVVGSVELLNNYYADDHRLSEFGAITGGLKLVFKQKPVDWIISAEYYTSGADMSLGKSEYVEHPAMLEYTKVTFGVEHNF
jgi:hypothetical protein